MLAIDVVCASGETQEVIMPSGARAFDLRQEVDHIFGKAHELLDPSGVKLKDTAPLEDGSMVWALCNCGARDNFWCVKDAVATLDEENNVYVTRRQGLRGPAIQMATEVKDVITTDYVIACLTSSGSVIVYYPGKGLAEEVEFLSSGVKMISASSFGFAAVMHDGSVRVAITTAFFSTDATLESGPVDDLAADVAEVWSTRFMYAALKSQGCVIVWGRVARQHTAPPLDDLSANVVQLIANDSAFAALKSDGSVLAWGDSSFGGDLQEVREELLDGVTELRRTEGGFSAVKCDGRVISWGTDDLDEDTLEQMFA
eukprot:TRINITY_DN40982_c0_g1_i1.p1 TRINITY_DN40982_c0_g1~~TRINITY_DN40982_c0_g1_i1.p1  ORF type:complete len:355 (-),score=43.76 TRINITY_DN40982_c0_g1_i1:158-1099(-)